MNLGFATAIRFRTFVKCPTFPFGAAMGIFQRVSHVTVHLGLRSVANGLVQDEATTRMDFEQPWKSVLL